jgi:hypothetical protein
VATVPSFTDGAVLHASDLQFLETPPQGGVYQATPQSFTTSTVTAVVWDTLWYDDDTTMWSSGSTLQLNTSGTWKFTVNVRWAVNTSGVRYLDLRKNSAGSGSGGVSLALDTRNATSPNLTAHGLTCTAPGLVAGDYVELFAFQSSGGNLAFLTGSIAGCASLAGQWIGA